MGGARLVAKYKKMYVSITAPMQLTYSIQLKRRRGEMIQGIKERFIGIACLLSPFFFQLPLLSLFLYLVFSQAHWIKWKCGKHGWLCTSSLFFGPAKYNQCMDHTQTNLSSYCISIYFIYFNNGWDEVQLQTTAFWVMHKQLVWLGLCNKSQV